MSKMVRYNGGNGNWGRCSDYRVLVPGMVYEVMRADVHHFYTNYSLKGVNGWYNSVWFEDLEPEMQVGPMYISIASKAPVVGEAMWRFNRVNPVSMVIEEMEHSSIVVYSEMITNGVYLTTTKSGSTYVVQVKEETPTSVYVGIASKDPVVGEKMKNMLRFNPTTGLFEDVKYTSTVVSIKTPVEGVYLAETSSGSTYVVQVGE